MARRIPRDRLPESTVALLTQGYDFAARRFRRLRSDIFEARLLGQRTVCITGESAARVFYREDRMQRATATPGALQRTLFGVGGVQGLDGEAHRHRKDVFMSLTSPERVDRLCERCALEWDAALRRWEREDSVVLLDEVEAILCRAVCAWAGVPLAEDEVHQRTRDLSSTVTGAGRADHRHIQARLARGRAERWAQSLIDRVRAGWLTAPAGSALMAFARHRGLDGALLDPRVAAVELLNVLRPTVAVGHYIVFVAMALQSYPRARRALADGTLGRRSFVEEVRRLYPFVPMMPARVRAGFEWEGYALEGGTRVALDIHGINHDPRLWDEPETFRPERFEGRQEEPFRFVPQGGGDAASGHRCPGETSTVALMETALHFLTEEMVYDVPSQDLRIPRWRLPARPNSKFVMSNVRRVGPGGAARGG